MKSTNVRMIAIRLAVRVLGRISPGIAARWMETMFLAVRRHPTPALETRWMEGARKRVVEHGAHRLVVHAFGEGEEGPSVLLSHGWEGRGSQLGAFVRPLRERGFRVLALDHPGHGASSGSSTSLPDMGKALVAVERELGPVHGVIAHSAGCAAATIALREGLGAARLVYVAPPTALESFFYQMVDRLGIDRALGEVVQARIERRIGMRWSDLRHPAMAPLQREPLLVIHDRGDRETPLSGAREIHRLWAGSRLLVTDGLGHRRILRNPDVIEAAANFVSQGIGMAGTGEANVEVSAVRRVS